MMRLEPTPSSVDGRTAERGNVFSGALFSLGADRTEGMSEPAVTTRREYAIHNAGRGHAHDKTTWLPREGQGNSSTRQA